MIMATRKARRARTRHPRRTAGRRLRAFRQRAAVIGILSHMDQRPQRSTRLLVG